MPSVSTLMGFLAAAIVLAAIPGPGLLYVLSRTVAGGRREGLASAFGSGLGGLVHVVAGAIGVSALLTASSTAFTILKLVGGLYLIYLGVQTWRWAPQPVHASERQASGASAALRQGVVVESTNPKTAAFFLALIPQFMDSERGAIAAQFLVLGLISVALNTTAAVLAAWGAASLRDKMLRRPRLLSRLQRGSGVVLSLLGLSVLLARQPAP